MEADVAERGAAGSAEDTTVEEGTVVVGVEGEKVVEEGVAVIEEDVAEEGLCDERATEALCEARSSRTGRS